MPKQHTPDEEAKIKLAKDTEDPNVLLELSKNEREECILSAVAANPKTPTEALEQLVNGGYIISQDLQSIANHHNVTVKLLDKLSYVDDIFVRNCVASSPKASDATLERLSRDSAAIVRECVAKNPDCPGGILDNLAQDKDINVRINIAKNPSTMRSALKNMAENDKNAVVRNFALKSLNIKKD